MRVAVSEFDPAAYRAWLSEQGAIFLAPTNEYEVIRYKIGERGKLGRAYPICKAISGAKAGPLAAAFMDSSASLRTLALRSKRPGLCAMRRAGSSRFWIAPRLNAHFFKKEFL